MRRFALSALALSGVMAGCGAELAPGAKKARGGNEAGAKRDFRPRVVIPRAFPAITNAPVIKVEKAAADVVREKELVLGVSVNGEARAYPINMLTGPRREIINDKLGGRAIAATW